MAILDNAAYPTRGFYLSAGGNPVAMLQSVGGLGGGGAPQQDATTLESTAREFFVGLREGSDVQLTGLAAPQSQAAITLNAALRDGSSVAVVAAYGGRPSGSRRTDGSAILVRDNLVLTSSGTGSADDPVVMTATAAATPGLPGVIDGDYIRWYADGATTASFSRITAREVNSTQQAKFTLADTAAITLETDASEAARNVQAILRPAVKWTFNAFVSDFSYNGGVDEQLQFSLTLRSTGDVDEALGTPTTTL